ncbi:hypothetical protein BGX31_011522 [Mortierella sp. GBA43]|nr:hypothetical protein BGX31_011522 [Mortierella sp. GBA43]
MIQDPLRQRRPQQPRLISITRHDRDRRQHLDAALMSQEIQRSSSSVPPRTTRLHSVVAFSSTSRPTRQRALRELSPSDVPRRSRDDIIPKQPLKTDAPSVRARKPFFDLGSPLRTVDQDDSSDQESFPRELCPRTASDYIVDERNDTSFERGSTARDSNDDIYHDSTSPSPSVEFRAVEKSGTRQLSRISLQPSQLSSSKTGTLRSTQNVYVEGYCDGRTFISQEPPDDLIESEASRSLRGMRKLHFPPQDRPIKHINKTTKTVNGVCKYSESDEEDRYHGEQDQDDHEFKETTVDEDTTYDNQQVYDDNSEQEAGEEGDYQEDEEHEGHQDDEDYKLPMDLRQSSRRRTLEKEATDFDSQSYWSTTSMGKGSQKTQSRDTLRQRDGRLRARGEENNAVKKTASGSKHYAAQTIEEVLPVSEQGRPGSDDREAGGHLDCHFLLGTSVQTVLAERNDQVHFRDAASGQYGIHSGPEDSNMCSGIISIPGKGLKPNQNAFLSTTIYCVIKGRVRATICRTSIIAGMGDSFMVPRGNQYMIENLSRDETRLFFVHSREAKKQGETVSDFAEYTELMGP